MADPNRAIAERARRRRAASATGLLLAALVAVWSVSSFTWAMASAPSLRCYLTYGRVHVEWTDLPISTWSFKAGVAAEGPRIELGFESSRVANALYLRVPLTGPVALSAFFFAAMLYRLKTYREEDHCAGCGYLLKGLRPKAGEALRCPECGRTVGEGA